MRYIIDRFEGKFAVVELEDRTMANVEKNALPANAKEGDVIFVDIEIEETQQRKDAIRAKMEKLIEK